jgi:glycosyltransferase involved in cell wall biosynthesis
MLLPCFDEVPGGWTYFKEMALRLAGAGVKIFVISPRAKGKRRKDKIGNVMVYRCSYFVYVPQMPLLLINPIDLLSTLRKIVREEKSIDMIYDTTSGAIPLSLIVKLFFELKGTSKPLVIHVHGELKELKSKRLLSLLFESYLHVGARMSFAIADRILLAGEKIAPRVLSLGARPSKVEIVRVGLRYEDKMLHRPNALSKEEKARMQTSVGLRNEDFVVGYVGRLSPGKGLDVLLRAVAMVRNEIPKLKAVLVGDGGEKAQLNAIASALRVKDIMIFLGHREDVPNLLQLMDVFVNVSESEAGISAVQLEAMRFALPTIITPYTDTVKHMKDAIVVPFNDPRAVAEAILLLYRNDSLRKTIGINASTRAQELLKKYTWRGYTDKVLEVFRNVTQSA